MNRGLSDLFSHHRRSRLDFGTAVCCALLAAAMLLPIASANAQLNSESPVPPASSEKAVEETQPAYIIQPGDELEIKFFYQPELNEKTTVRPDGRISLQLVPETQAAGHTVASLTDALRQTYANKLVNLDLTVFVRTSAARVYVDGEVLRPGEIALNRPLSLVQAVAEAGGMKETARLREVLLIRRSRPEDKPMVVVFDYQQAVSEKGADRNLELQPYDIVFVSRSRIANVNKWVDQYIRKNIPVTFGWYRAM